MEFERNIKDWIIIDNKIKTINNQLKELRSEKNNLNSVIVDYAKLNNYCSSIINITDGKLKFVNSNYAEPLTFKYIENTLNKILPDSKHVEFILKTLKDNRTIKNNIEIKRFSNK